jgi:hypothetical protein
VTRAMIALQCVNSDTPLGARHALAEAARADALQRAPDAALAHPPACQSARTSSLAGAGPR